MKCILQCDVVWLRDDVDWMTGWAQWQSSFLSMTRRM